MPLFKTNKNKLISEETFKEMLKNSLTLKDRATLILLYHLGMTPSDLFKLHRFGITISESRLLLQINHDKPIREIKQIDTDNPIIWDVIQYMNVSKHLDYPYRYGETLSGHSGSLDKLIKKNDTELSSYNFRLTAIINRINKDQLHMKSKNLSMFMYDFGIGERATACKYLKLAEELK